MDKNTLEQSLNEYVELVDKNLKEIAEKATEVFKGVDSNTAYFHSQIFFNDLSNSHITIKTSLPRHLLQMQNIEKSLKEKADKAVK